MAQQPSLATTFSEKLKVVGAKAGGGDLKVGVPTQVNCWRAAGTAASAAAPTGH